MRLVQAVDLNVGDIVRNHGVPDRRITKITRVGEDWTSTLIIETEDVNPRYLRYSGPLEQFVVLDSTPAHEDDEPDLEPINDCEVCGAHEGEYHTEDECLK